MQRLHELVQVLEMLLRRVTEHDYVVDIHAGEVRQAVQVQLVLHDLLKVRGRVH